MEVIRRISQRFPSTILAGEYFILAKTRAQHKSVLNPRLPQFNPTSNVTIRRGFSSPSTARTQTSASSLVGLGNKKKLTRHLVNEFFPWELYFVMGFAFGMIGIWWWYLKSLMDFRSILGAGNPVLHKPARKVSPEEVRSGRIQKIIDYMVQVMRRRSAVGLAAPQIGIPLKIIVLEDTKKYIALAPEEENKAQDRRPFDLLVILNPKLKKKSNKTALFFEVCLSVNGYTAMVERFLEVEVTGLDRNGKPIKVDACGWQARILQHECDHLKGTLYVDKMVKRTFRTVENFGLPLANDCPKQGVR